MYGIKRIKAFRPDGHPKRPNKVNQTTGKSNCQ